MELYVIDKKVFYRCDKCKKEKRAEGAYNSIPDGWVTLRYNGCDAHACSFKCAVRLLSRYFYLPGWREREARRALISEGEF